jgi:hypothetical protein
MAQTIRPEAVAAAMARHMQPGEFLRHAVYGREVEIWKLMLLMLGSLVPAGFIGYALIGPPMGMLRGGLYGLIWAAIWVYPMTRIAKDYIFALTDRRAILVQIQTPLFSIDLNKQKSAQTWPLNAVPAVVGNAGAMFAKLAIYTPQRKVGMRVGYVGQSGAKFQTESILSILSSLRGSGPAY